MSLSETDARRSWLPLHRHCVSDRADARIRLAAMSTIAAILVHEVSQPISALTNQIRGCASRLRNRTGSAEDLLPMIEDAGREIAKIGEIIRRMRGFIVSGKIGGRPESLAAMIVSAGAEPICPGGVKAEIDTAIEPEADRVIVDRFLVEQVLSILIANACEALAGSDVRRIAIGAARRGGNVVVRIQDSGPGLSHYQFIHLFEPLFTAKSPGKGLEMPICRTIVEAQGGRLRAERPGADGTTFILTFPAAE